MTNGHSSSQSSANTVESSNNPRPPLWEAPSGPPCYYAKGHAKHGARIPCCSLRGSAWVAVELQAPYNILAVGDEFTSLFGYTADQVTGRSLKLFHGPRTIPHVLCVGIKSVAIMQRSTDFETILYNRSGEELNATVYCSPVTDASGAVVCCMEVSLYDTDRPLDSQSAIRPTPSEIECRRLHNRQTGLLLQQELSHGLNGPMRKELHDTSLFDHLLAEISAGV